MSSNKAEILDCEISTSIIDEKIINEFLCQEHTKLMMNMEADGTFVAPASARNLGNGEPGTDELCFDHNRVILKEEKESSDYINASYIDSFKQPKAYIVTKTPDSEAEIHKFWKMVWEQQSEVIVMLNKPDQNEKGVLYWKLEERATLYCGKLNVETIKVRHLHHSFEITTLLITHEDGGSLLVDHFLYKNWPKIDSVPPGADFLDLVNMTRTDTRYVQKLSEGFKTPVVVHCSDGLNRSIVFCVIDISITKDQKVVDVNIFSIVSQLRKQRYNCLHNVDHYIFCYSAFCEYLNLYT
ncbi:protein tyrosine phosphatase [Cotesia vestalis bracovirus]|nr:protein tyrosine phosphatase [Cotesia vestalis bracovirus]